MRQSDVFRSLLLASSAGAALLALPAAAQDVPASPAAPAEEASDAREILVTGSRI